MRIVIAPNSFKGTLTAAQACAAMACGVRLAVPGAEIVEAPLADGGEGTLEAILAATGGSRRVVEVTGPLGEPVAAGFGLLDGGRRAVIEMAAASGLLLVPADRRDVLRATTYGTGELIRAALDAGARELLVGIGGSATCDGGCGMAQALGYRLIGRDGAALPDGIGGGALHEITRIDATGCDGRIAGATIDVLCDVTNPLTGPEGSAAVYGPQKGASPADVAVLDRNLDHLAGLIARDVPAGGEGLPVPAGGDGGRVPAGGDGLHVPAGGEGLRVPADALAADIRTLPGGGAAGGLGAGLVAFLHARLRSGAQAVIDFIRLEERCRGADFILTGEGCFDRQSLSGKSLSALADLGARLGIPVLVVAGRIDLPASAWPASIAAAVASAGEHADPATAVSRATGRCARTVIGDMPSAEG